MDDILQLPDESILDYANDIRDWSTIDCLVTQAVKLNKSSELIKSLKKRCRDVWYKYEKSYY